MRQNEEPRMEAYANVLIHILSQYPAAMIVGSEVHVERIHHAVAAVIDDYGSISSADRRVGFIGFHSIQPGWGLSNIIDGRKIYIRYIIGVE